MDKAVRICLKIEKKLFDKYGMHNMDRIELLECLQPQTHAVIIRKNSQNPEDGAIWIFHEKNGWLVQFGREGNTRMEDHNMNTEHVLEVINQNPEPLPEDYE